MPQKTGNENSDRINNKLAVQSFWKTEIAQQKIRIWKKTIAANCSAQFQFQFLRCNKFKKAKLEPVTSNVNLMTIPTANDAVKTTQMLS